MFDSRNLATQLNITKTHAENKLKYLLAEIKSFKLQIRLQVTYRKEKQNGEIKYSLSNFLFAIH